MLDVREEAGSQVKRRLIHLLLWLYPPGWRLRYEDEYVALLEEIPCTPWNLADIVLGALDARLHPLGFASTTGRVGSMSAAVKRLRAAEIAIFCAFAGFVVSFISLQREVDPSAPFDAIGAAHPDVGAAYQIVQYGMYVALLAVMVAGFPVAFVAVRRAWGERRWGIVWLFATPIILTGFYLTYTGVLFLTANRTNGSLTPTRLNIILLLLWVLFSGLYGVVSAITISVGVARSTFDGRVLRFALIPGAVAGLAMLVSVASSIYWGIRLFIVAPQLYGNFGGACTAASCVGTHGAISIGSLAVTLSLMTISTLLALAALVWGLGARGATPSASSLAEGAAQMA